MKVDHEEFIKRHHKVEEPGSGEPPKKVKRDLRSWSALLIIALYIGLFSFIILVSEMSVQDLMMAAGLFVLTTALAAFTAYSSSQNVVLEEERVLLRQVMEGSRGARLIADSSDQTVYANDKFKELCKGLGPPGYKSLIRLFEDNEEALAHFRLLADQAHRGLTDTIELFSKHEDRDRWFMVTAQPVMGWKGYIHWRIDDVTQRHTIDRAIREEREKLIDFTDNAPVGFFSVDENGKFVFANATFARWVGHDIRTLLDTSTLHTYLAEAPKNAAPYDLIDNGGARQVVELQMKGAGGKTFLASVNQAVVHENDGRVRTRGVVHDLTSEREMRQALKASEDRFERFFEEAPLGIVLIDQERVIQDINAEFATMLGKSVFELEGKPLEELILEEERTELFAAISRLEQGAQMGTALDVTLKKDGDDLMTQLHARRFREGEDIVLHFIDRSEQKSLEQQFVQSQKMQAIGQLAGGVAHDFNNLLTAIIGFCDLLLLRHKPGDPSFSDINQIKQNSNRASNLVRQLLAFSRQQTLRPKVQDIGDILTELSHLMRRLIGANIELDVLHGDDLGLVKVDEGQMEQVLINLAVNARDAMDGGGELTISTENFTTRKPVELISEELPPGHWVTIKVMDTGCGIPKENMARIFEPFFTTKAIGEGTGLGLATVYGIIRQTGGFLDVESVVDQGTSFIIYLPRASEQDIQHEEENADEADDVASRDLTGTERILLVEDEDAVRTFSERALMNKGYEVVGAESGERALEVFEENKDKPFDLLVTDVVMPNMDGPTMAAKIRESHPDLKIIFVSGYTEDKLKDHMDDKTHFLPKPFTLKKLAAKVKEVLDA